MLNIANFRIRCNANSAALSISYGLLFCIFTPIALLFLSFFQPELSIWSHLLDTILIEVIQNSVLLGLGVVSISSIIGVYLAWIVSSYNFPLRNFFSWSLLLPMSLPAYVLAFIHQGFFEYTGDLQSFLRIQLETDKNLFAFLQGGFGLILVMSFVSYPYVYFLCRQAFLFQSETYREAAESLGYSKSQVFLRLQLPMAKPWILAAMTIILMETLADFGAVSIFNFYTFTTAIYKSWFSLFSFSAAQQLASSLLLILIIAFYFEKSFRKKIVIPQSNLPKKRQKPKSIMAAFYFLTCTLIFCIAFLLPILQLLFWSFQSLDKGWLNSLWTYLSNSFFISFIASLCILFVSICFSYSRRLYKNSHFSRFYELALLGYAVPGTVMAVAVYIPLLYFDKAFSWLFDQDHLILQGSLFAMIFSYLCRFLRVGFKPIDSGLVSIPKNMDEASLSLGVKGFAMFSRVHLPLLKPSFFTAFLFAFVEVIKEMPISLMTRPFGWDSLSVRIFELTSEAQWTEAALPALCIVCLGLIPVYFLARSQELNDAS